MDITLSRFDAVFCFNHNIFHCAYNIRSKKYYSQLTTNTAYIHTKYIWGQKKYLYDIYHPTTTLHHILICIYLFIPHSFVAFICFGSKLNCSVNFNFIIERIHVKSSR